MIRRALPISVDFWLGVLVLVAAVVLSGYSVIAGRWGEDPFLPGRVDLLALPYRIDLDVYRLGADTLLRGQDLYGQLPDTHIGVNLPFTYPPLAAVLFVPLAWLPHRAANLLVSLGTVGLVVLVMTLVTREVSRHRGPALLAAGLVAGSAALWFGPVRETVEFGQVNVALMALVVVDVVVGRGRPWQGTLTGFAMAIKLTPAVFLAYFFATRRWRALATAALSAVALTGLGFVLAWEDSAVYWTHTIADPGRIGGLDYVSNQSINGALLRLGLSGHAAPVWFLLSAALGLSLLGLMCRLSRQGHDLAAMLVMGVYALLASPVSWSHHWVWAAPALLVVVVRAHRTRSTSAWALALAGLAVFVGRAIWDVPEDAPHGLGWTWQQQLVGDAQLLWGLAFLGFLAVGSVLEDAHRTDDAQTDPGAQLGRLVAVDSSAH